MNPEQLIDLALKSGVDEAEVYQVRSFSRPVFFEANRLKQLESSQSEGLALRIWKNGCPGLAIAYGEVDPETVVEKAIALSKLNEPETPELSDPRHEIHHDQGDSIAVETLVEIGKNSISQIREIYPDVLCNGQFECETETTLLINSQGLYCEYTDTSTNYYLGVEWIRQEDFLGVYDGDTTQHLPDTTIVIQNILKRIKWAEINIDFSSRKVPVLLTPNAANLLWETVSDALNGKRIKEKSSPWSNKLEQRVMSPKISLSQDPTVAPYGCPFDDEGTPTQRLSLIEQGRLKQFYCDRKTARQLGLKSSGNGFRPSLSNYPTPSLVNLIVNSGKGNLEALISQMDQGLMVDQLLGESSDISGDFSVNIDLGYRIEKGQIVGRVKDTMISGNVYTALQEIDDLGDDRRWNGSCYTPSLIVGELSVIQ